MYKRSVCSSVRAGRFSASASSFSTSSFVPALGRHSSTQNVTGSRSYTTAPAQQADAKPYTEMPTVGIQEVMALGGFGKVLDVMASLQKSHGNLVRLSIPGNDAIYVFDPEDIGTVMQNEGKWPVGAASTVWPMGLAFKRRGDNNVAFAQGENWKRLRVALQKNMTPPLEAETYVPLVSPVVEQGVKEIIKHGHDIDHFTPRMTLEMIAAVLFGEPLGTLSGTAPQEDVRYIDEVLKVFELSEQMMFRSPDQVPPEEMKPFEEAFDYIIDRGMYHVNRVLAKHEAGKLSTAAPPYIMKVLQQKDITLEEVTKNVAGLLLAGVDTTSNTMQWFLYNMAKFPKAQENLHTELKSVLKGRHLSRDDLNDLPYLKATLKETFRLTPTTAGTARILYEPLTLKGYQVPPGTMFMLSPWPLQKDSSVFEQPDEFLPERYDKKGKGERSKNNPYHDSPYMHMPFSRGPRMCMGARLAELELFSFMARFGQDCKIALSPSSPTPEAINKLTIRPLPSPTYDISSRV